jgi:hypothetical protein
MEMVLRYPKDAHVICLLYVLEAEKSWPPGQLFSFLVLFAITCLLSDPFAAFNKLLVVHDQVDFGLNEIIV